MVTFLLLAQAATPGDCILSGLCGVAPAAAPPVPAGVMYLAVGMVIAGTIGWRRARRQQPESEPPSS